MTTQRVHIRMNKGIYRELEYLKDEYEINTGRFISINQLVNLACCLLIENEDNLEYIKKNRE